MSLDKSFADIKEIYPSLGDEKTLYMLEHLGVWVKLTAPHPPTALRVQLWTNLLTKFNSEGSWYGLDLDYKGEESGVYLFAGSFMPTSVGNYEFTYRVGEGLKETEWHWIGEFGDNGRVKVEPPSESMQWTQGASAVEVWENVYVGNFIAASNARELGFDAVLNLAAELLVNFEEHGEIAYRKIGLLDGAHHGIPEAEMLAAIAWIEEQIERGKKILIHCRAGIGRSGSLGVAYCFRQNPQWTYQETLDYIWSKKPDIYPHKNLQATLERLFPRS